MKKSLITFRFDPEKSGSVLKRFTKDAGMSYQKLADSIGYSYDTINNSLSGKIKDLSLERVFKICTITGHSVCEYLHLMLQDEDIDFELVPYTESVVQDTQKTETDVQHPVNLAVADQNPMCQAAYNAMMQQAEATHQANLERSSAIHDGYVNMLEDSHKKAIEDQEKAHQEHVDTVRKVARQRLRWIILLTVLLLVFIAWFIWDISHPDIGLISIKQAGDFFGTYM